MSNVIVNNAKSTHYAVSTFAAVVYALVWLVSNRAHAETSTASAAMPEIVVTGKRVAMQTDIPEIVVWGKREVATPVMTEIVVWGKRETSNNDQRVAAAATNSPVVASASASGGLLSRARHWLQTALLQ
jgi:hypothetical protein